MANTEFSHYAKQTFSGWYIIFCCCYFDILHLVEVFSLHNSVYNTQCNATLHCSIARFFPLKNARASFVKVLLEIRLNVVVRVLNAHPSLVYYGTVL